MGLVDVLLIFTIMEASAFDGTLSHGLYKCSSEVHLLISKDFELNHLGNDFIYIGSEALGLQTR